jgi:hypothetical protein
MGDRDVHLLDKIVIDRLKLFPPTVHLDPTPSDGLGWRIVKETPGLLTLPTFFIAPYQTAIWLAYTFHRNNLWAYLARSTNMPWLNNLDLWNMIFNPWLGEVLDSEIAVGLGDAAAAILNAIPISRAALGMIKGIGYAIGGIDPAAVAISDTADNLIDDMFGTNIVGKFLKTLTFPNNEKQGLSFGGLLM